MTPDWSSTDRYYRDHADQYALVANDLSMEIHLESFCAGLMPGAGVLDIGCGSGRDLAQILRRGFWAIGLDKSHPLAQIAHRRTGAPIVVGDLRFPPFKRASFDGIWSSATLLHIPRAEIDTTLRAIRDLLTPSGIFFLSLKEGLGQDRDQNGRWFTYFGREEIVSRLQRAGFTLEHLEENKLMGVSNGRWLSILARAI